MEEQMLMQPVDATGLTAVDGGSMSLLGFVLALSGNSTAGELLDNMIAQAGPKTIVNNVCVGGGCTYVNNNQCGK
jgi:hypothetical protein